MQGHVAAVLEPHDSLQTRWCTHGFRNRTTRRVFRLRCQRSACIYSTHRQTEKKSSLVEQKRKKESSKIDVRSDPRVRERVKKLAWNFSVDVLVRQERCFHGLAGVAWRACLAETVGRYVAVLSGVHGLLRWTAYRAQRWRQIRLRRFRQLLSLRLHIYVFITQNLMYRLAAI